MSVNNLDDDKRITPLNMSISEAKYKFENSKEKISNIEEKNSNIEEVNFDEFFSKKNGFDVSLEDLLSVEEFNKAHGNDSFDNVELL